MYKLLIVESTNNLVNSTNSRILGMVARSPEESHSDGHRSRYSGCIVKDIVETVRYIELGLSTSLTVISCLILTGKIRLKQAGIDDSGLMNATHPPPVWIFLIRRSQTACWHISCFQRNALHLVSLPVVKLHIQADSKSDHCGHEAETCGDDRRWNVIGRILWSEDVAGYQTHGVRDRDQYWCQDGPLVLVWSIIVVPG